MKYRVVSTADRPVHLPFGGRNPVTLAKRGADAEVDLSEAVAQRIAAHGCVRFEVVVAAPPAASPAPAKAAKSKPAEPAPPTVPPETTKPE